MEIESNLLFCDFCNAPAPQWWYKAGETAVALSGPGNRVAILRSTADWAACQECHELIQADEPKKLLRRSVGIIAAQRLRDAGQPMILNTSEMEDLVWTLQSDFWAQRQAGFRPIEDFIKQEQGQ
jgi:hypothetical protein